jgi:hypothetical protein
MTQENRGCTNITCNITNLCNIINRVVWWIGSNVSVEFITLKKWEAGYSKIRYPSTKLCNAIYQKTVLFIIENFRSHTFATLASSYVRNQGDLKVHGVR